MARRLNTIKPHSEEAKQVKVDFRQRVNMAPAEIEKWLETDASKSVGQREGSGSTVGRNSARRIVSIKRKRASDLSGADLAHMKKVNGYIARHLAQRPEKPKHELGESDWAYSLKNWGHDPLK